MGLPPKKGTKTKQLKRRSHHALKKVSLGVCPDCGAKKLPHHACPSCGKYKGR
ncbi:MAG: 50S ribosomal protein L32 [Patescibacteria group bacterium]